MLQRRDVIAAGIGLALAVAVAAAWRGGAAPERVAVVAPTSMARPPEPPSPPAAPAPPAAPIAPADPAERVDPLPGETLKDDPVEDARVHARWQARLSREDEALVGQAVAAGCDPARAERMRELLDAKRRVRARTIEDYRAGRLDRDAMAARARDTKRRTDEALRALLTSTELAALDPGAARAAAVDEKD